MTLKEQESEVPETSLTIGAIETKNYSTDFNNSVGVDMRCVCQQTFGDHETSPIIEKIDLQSKVFQ